MDITVWTLERLSTPLGEMLIASDARQRLRAIEWLDCEARMHSLLRRQYPRGLPKLVDSAQASDAARAMQAYFGGDLDAIHGLDIGLGGTNFQRQIWLLLQAIPAGQTVTYRELAARAGRPDAARAVGAANGANPLAIVVPCHRVVGSDRSLTGYAGGLARKQWLLEHERKIAEQEPECMRSPGASH